jgi:hypothetical protein
MPKEVETGSDKTAIRPFHVNIPEEELTDLRRRRQRRASAVGEGDHVFRAFAGVCEIIPGLIE